MDEVVKVTQCVSQNICCELNGQHKPRYTHMGALIVDSILQAGLNYVSVVLPRIEKILLNYPNFVTSVDFLILLQTYDIHKMIHWNDSTKTNRIFLLTKIFVEENIMTVEDLSQWIRIDKNKMKLKEISGIGPKTVDYISILCGNDEIAIDRHLMAFLELAGCPKLPYYQTKAIYESVSKQLNVSLVCLDESIWNFMRNNTVLPTS